MLVSAYSKSTGQKHIIPEHWLSIDAAPFNDFQKTPRQKSADKAGSSAKPTKKEA